MPIKPLPSYAFVSIIKSDVLRTAVKVKSIDEAKEVGWDGKGMETMACTL
jgi:hypothetical protein